MLKNLKLGQSIVIAGPDTALSGQSFVDLVTEYTELTKKSQESMLEF